MSTHVIHRYGTTAWCNKPKTCNETSYKHYQNRQVQAWLDTRHTECRRLILYGRQDTYQQEVFGEHLRAMSKGDSEHLLEVTAQQRYGEMQGEKRAFSTRDNCLKCRARQN